VSKKILSEMKRETMLVHDVGESIAIINEARRDYENALAKIRQYEAFLAPYFVGLNYDEMKFRVGEDPITYAAGSLQPCEYWPYLAKGERGWHFMLAEVEPVDGVPTLIHFDKAKRLVDAPAGLVLHCAGLTALWAGTVLEDLAWLLDDSYISSRKRRAAVAQGSAPPALPMLMSEMN
jgi:hypothetical protein